MACLVYADLGAFRADDASVWVFKIELDSGTGLMRRCMSLAGGHGSATSSDIAPQSGTNSPRSGAGCTTKS